MLREGAKKEHPKSRGRENHIKCCCIRKIGHLNAVYFWPALGLHFSLHLSKAKLSPPPRERRQLRKARGDMMHSKLYFASSSILRLPVCMSSGFISLFPFNFFLIHPSLACSSSSLALFPLSPSLSLSFLMLSTFSFHSLSSFNRFNLSTFHV